MGVSLESRYKGTKIFTPCPQKIGFWAQKRPNLAQNWHFGPNISIFGPFDLMRDQKTMQTSCQSGFLLCWYQNFYLLPKKSGFLAQKRPNLVQNLHFWSFWAKYCHFLPILSNARPKNNVNKVPGWVFRYVGYKLLISLVKKGFFAQNDQIWSKIGIVGQFGPGHAGLFSALLVGRLVFVALGLYLARHLFTLFIMTGSIISTSSLYFRHDRAVD